MLFLTFVQRLSRPITDAVRRLSRGRPPHRRLAGLHVGLRLSDNRQACLPEVVSAVLLATYSLNLEAGTQLIPKSTAKRSNMEVGAFSPSSSRR